MKRLLIGLAIAAIAAFSTLPVSAETTIRVTLQLPEKHSLGQNWLAFKKIVEEKSGGELKIELFPSAQLYKDKQVPEAVGSGAIEAGSAFLGRFAGSVPAEAKGANKQSRSMEDIHLISTPRDPQALSI